MSKGDRKTQSIVIRDPSPAVESRRPQPSATISTPTPRDLSRFTERCRARDLGFELPLNTREAAGYVGLHPKTVERIARMGEIPAHPVCGTRRKTWKYYPSELDAWLRAKVDSSRHPCSPDGKDTKQ